MSRSDYSSFEHRLAASRSACSHGAILTRAHVQPNTLSVITLFELQCGLHVFPKTLLLFATILVRDNTRPGISGVQNPVVNMIRKEKELIVEFHENRGNYYLMPRDALLRTFGQTCVMTFLTLRNVSSQAGLFYQTITFNYLAASNEVATQAIQGHLHPADEVRAKMRNAMRQIPIMPKIYPVTYEDKPTPEQPIDKVEEDHKEKPGPAVQLDKASRQPRQQKKVKVKRAYVKRTAKVGI